jgi:Dolichyl-phosphate-mannose-protein mannosyltransferase
MRKTTWQKFPWEKILFLVLLGLAVGLVLLQANPLTNAPSRDGGLYAYVGNIVREGKLPYINAWENKPPGIFYLDAFALWLGFRWGIWLVEYLFLFTAAWAGYWLMRRLWQPGAAIFGTAAWLLSLNSVLSGGNLTEEYPLLFSFLAIGFFWLSIQNPKKLVYDALVGVMLALGFLFRPNTIGVQIAIVLAWVIILLVTRKFKLLVTKMAVMGISVLVILGGVCVYFWAKGALRPMIDAAILYNLSYTSDHANMWANIIASSKSLGYFVWVALVGYLCALFFLARSIKAKALDAWALLLVIDGPIEIFFSSLSGREYSHYFISWMPMIGFLSGMAFSSLAPHILSLKLNTFLNKRTSYVYALVLILLVIFCWPGILAYQNIFNHIAFDRASGIEITSPLVKYLRQNTRPGDTILAWGGQSGINLMAHRDAPTAYIFYPLLVDSPLLVQMDNGFYHDITSNPPLLIVDAYVDAPDDVLSLDPTVRAWQLANHKGQGYHPPQLNRVFDYIGQNYTQVTVIDHYPVYRLNHP